MDELPHRAVIDLEAALGKLRDKPAQSEVLLLAALKQPVAMRVADRPWLVPPHLTGRDAARLAEVPYPCELYAATWAWAAPTTRAREPSSIASVGLKWLAQKKEDVPAGKFAGGIGVTILNRV